MTSVCPSVGNTAMDEFRGFNLIMVVSHRRRNILDSQYLEIPLPRQANTGTQFNLETFVMSETDSNTGIPSTLRHVCQHSNTSWNVMLVVYLAYCFHGWIHVDNTFLHHMEHFGHFSIARFCCWSFASVSIGSWTVQSKVRIYTTSKGLQYR